MSVDRDKLQARLDELAAKHSVVGASVGVLTGDQIIAAATGTANRNTDLAATTDTVFQIGSITKVYTATLVMQLVDEGLVELDAPVKTYVPDLKLGDPAATETITVRQLLSHTSGLEGDHFEDFGRGDDNIARYVESCAQLPQLFEPGRMSSYSNAGWVILGRVVEVVRGKPFRDAMNDHLLTPAGLSDSPQLAEEAILRRAAVGHLPDPDAPGTWRVAPVYNLSPASAPAGAMQMATIADLLGFARLHLDGGVAADGTQVLSVESAAAMREPQVELADTHTLGDAWGLGWILMTWDGHRVIGHDGATIGQGAFLRLLPEQNLAIGLLTNGGDMRALFSDLFDELFRDLAGIGMPQLPPVLEDTAGIDLDRFTGTYERLSLRLDITAVDGRLTLKMTLSGPLASLMPPPPDKELLVGGDNLLYLPPDDPSGKLTPMVFFDPDASGRPQWVHFGARAARRVQGS